MIDLIKNVFGNNVWLATMFVAMLPIFEVRGAIPFGMSAQVWGAYRLNWFAAAAFSLIGITIVMPVIFICFEPFVNFLKNKKSTKLTIEKFENKLKVKSKSITNKNSNYIKMLLVVLLVAVPLPLTGAYSATIISIMAGLNFYQTFISVTVGNIVCAGLVAAISESLKDYSLIFIYVFIAILFVIMLCGILKKWRQKRKI